jgi:hypothetical protein
MNSRTPALPLAVGWAGGHAAGVKARFTLVLFFLFAVIARAADWKVEHLNRADPLREGGPIPLRLAITNPGTAPVEGSIESRIEVAGSTVAVHRTPTLFLTPGRQVVPLLLPPAAAEEGVDRHVTVRFLVKGAVFPLGEFPLACEGGERFVVAHVKDDAPREDDGAFAQRMQFRAVQAAWPALPRGVNPGVGLDRGMVFEPDGGKYVFGSPRPEEDDAKLSRAERALRFRPFWMTTDDLPTSPLAYCAYDCVVLHRDALSSARSKQLEALAQWVDSGGRLLVLTAERKEKGIPVRSERAFAFLRRLSCDHARIAWTPTAEGTLPELAEGPRLLFTGCGRTAVAAAPEVLVDEALRDTLRHLTGSAEGYRVTPVLSVRISGEEERASELKLAIGSALLPDSPRPIPLEKILWIMAAFIVLAVLGDYLFLGWLRMRKCTWILFPALALAATTGTLAYAHRHMNSLEQRGVLRIVDLGLDGRILREVRFTAILPSRSRATREESQQALAREIPFVSSGTRFSGRWGSGNESVEMTGDLEGNLAATSRLQVSLRQWTPLLLWAYSPAGGPDDSGIQWEKWTPTPVNSYVPVDAIAALDPSGTYSFAFRDNYQNDEGVNFLARKLMAYARYYTRTGAFEFPYAGELLPRLPEFRAFERRRDVLLAIRRDGANITCYRKMVRVDRATASNP